MTGLTYYNVTYLKTFAIVNKVHSLGYINHYFIVFYMENYYYYYLLFLIELLIKSALPLVFIQHNDD